MVIMEAPILGFVEVRKGLHYFVEALMAHEEQSSTCDNMIHVKISLDDQAPSLEDRTLACAV